MKPEEILERSRRENKHRDLAELEVTVAAGAIAGRVGATVCCLLSILSLWITGTLLLSPWVIYCSILGTNWLVRYRKMQLKSDLVVSVLMYGLAIAALVLLILRLVAAR